MEPLRPHTSISCHYLPELGLDNLRACCLPWKWWPFLRPPLRNRTLIPRTRYNHRSPLHCGLKLIGQKLVCIIGNLCTRFASSLTMNHLKIRNLRPGLVSFLVNALFAGLPPFQAFCNRKTIAIYAHSISDTLNTIDFEGKQFLSQ